MLKRIGIYICAALMGVGCAVDSLGFKAEEYDTTLVLISVEQLESGGDYIPLDGVVAYAFAADTTDFQVLSYEDALAGVVSSKADGSRIEPIATATPYSGAEALECAIEMRITNYESVMLVVADAKSEGYGYANYEIGLNLENTYITLSFLAWREGWYSQSFWQFIMSETETETESESETETDIETE